MAYYRDSEDVISSAEGDELKLWVHQTFAELIAYLLTAFGVRAMGKKKEEGQRSILQKNLNSFS